MKPCHLTITTTIEDEETSISRNGEFALSSFSAKVCYREENALVCLEWEDHTLKIERLGDYTLRLFLQEDEITSGSIGLSGAEGEIQTYTSRLACSLQKQSFLCSAHYVLIFGEEKQRMKIRLFAKGI